jgi:hypothetical protein
VEDELGPSTSGAAYAVGAAQGQWGAAQEAEGGAEEAAPVVPPRPRRAGTDTLPADLAAVEEEAGPAAMEGEVGAAEPAEVGEGEARMLNMIVACPDGATPGSVFVVTGPDGRVLEIEVRAPPLGHSFDHARGGL